MKLRYFTVVFLVLAAVCLSQGCGSNPPAIGIAAFDAPAVRTADWAAERWIMGNEKGMVDLNDANANESRELVRVFVEPSLVEDFAVQQNTRFNRASAENELTKTTRDSASAWGRFVVTGNRESADFVVQSRLTSLALDGDWSKSDRQIEDAYGGIFRSASETKDLARDILYAPISLTFTDAKSGDQVLNTYALGRMVRNKGEIVTKLIGADGREYSSTDRSGGAEIQSGVINEELLPQVFRSAVDGAFVLSFRQLDSRLWAAELQNGRRPRRSDDSQLTVIGTGTKPNQTADIK